MTAPTERAQGNPEPGAERVLSLLQAHSDAAERERRLPEAVIAEMQRDNLFNLWLPREYGGVELDFLSYITLVERMSAIDSAAGWVFTNMATSAVQAAFLPDEGAREIYKPGMLTAGSVIPRGRAVPVEGGYRLSGRWPLVSGCHHAQWIGGNSLVFDGDAPRMSPDGAPEFTLMFFPAEECTVLDTWYSTGMRGTGSTDVVVEDVFVPAHRTFPLFTARSRVEGLLYRLGIDVLFLTALSNVGLGIARAAIDAFIEMAREKTPTLSQTGLAVRPTVHAEVARAEARLQSARAYMHEVGREMVGAVAGADHLPPELEARRRLACVNAAEASEHVVDSMFRLAGSTAIYAGQVLDRCLRDIHTVNQHLAVSPVWWEKTGQFYFGLGLGMP